MNFKRQEYLSREELKMEECGNFPMTKEDEIRSLKTLIECMKEAENYMEEEFEKIYRDELQKINDKYDIHNK